MKNVLIAILLVASIAFASLGIVQAKKIRAQSVQLADTQKQLDAVGAQFKERTEAVEKARLAETKARILQETLTATAENVVQKSNEAARLEQSLATAKTNNAGSMMSAMFKDPKMKEMIKSQQKMVLGPMIEKNYSDFFQQAGLSADQSATLKDLLQKKMLVAADAGMSLMDGSLDATQRKDLVNQIKTDTDAFDAQIKDFLGEDNFKSFQSYEKTIPDRMLIGQFNDQFAGSGNALTSAQQQQLIQAMSDDRNNFKWTADFNKQNPADGDLAAMFTEDKIAQFAKEREQFDAQFLPKAQQILSPEQFTAYQQFQTAQRELQINGLRLAAKMFGQ
jgi:hypothetical protein